MDTEHFPPNMIEVEYAKKESISRYTLSIHSKYNISLMLVEVVMLKVIRAEFHGGRPECVRPRANLLVGQIFTNNVILPMNKI